MFDLQAAGTAIAQLLDAVGAPMNEHTALTPQRVAKAWAHQLAGYDTDPSEHLDITFPIIGDAGLVIVSGIEIHSTCAHHLLPITGTATIGYKPNPQGRVVGLSKLSRLADGYARRLQVQEQLGNQIVEAINNKLHPYGAGCIITATHGCMTTRGVQQTHTQTTTHNYTGDWNDTTHPERLLLLAEHNTPR